MVPNIDQPPNGTNNGPSQSNRAGNGKAPAKKTPRKTAASSKKAAAKSASTTKTTAGGGSGTKLVTGSGGAPPPGDPPPPATQIPYGNGIPARFHSPESWFFRGLVRQGTGSVVALLASYTALIVALWYAVIGGLLGILLAFKAIQSNSITHALFHAGAGTSVSFVAVVTGALAGAGGSFVSFYTQTIASDPFSVLVGVVAGAILAMIIVAVVAFFEGQFLALRGHRQLTVSEAERISPILQNVASRYGLRSVPRFAMLDSPLPNAAAVMRHIVLNTGLLDSLDDEPLAAVIAHELHHWRQGDSVGLHFVWACAWPVILVYNIASALSGGNRDDGRDSPAQAAPRGFIAIVAWIIAWPAWLLIKGPITIAMRSESRRQEYEADAAAKQIGLASPLQKALAEIGLTEGSRSGWQRALYATHPPVRQRIDRLEVRQEHHADFVEPELGAESAWAVSLIMALAITLAFFIAAGAVINSQRTNDATSSVASAGPGPFTTPTQPPLLQSQVNQVERTAAAFTTQIIDNAYDPTRYGPVIAQFVPSPDQQATLNNAAANYASDLYGKSPSEVTSQATVLACMLEPNATPTTATVGVFVRWNSGVDGNTAYQWFTDNIPMDMLGGQWMPTNVPQNLPGIANNFGSDVAQYQDSAIPTGYITCP